MNNNQTDMNNPIMETTNRPLSGIKTRTGLHAGKPLGDCVADLTHFTGLDKLAELYTQVTGKDCGCKARQEWLNRISPDFLGK